MAEHPRQPTYIDKHDVTRFWPNPIVRYLLDAGPFDMNDLAKMNDRFTAADRRQFAQLIGYSVCGYCDLSYVTGAR